MSKSIIAFNAIYKQLYSKAFFFTKSYVHDVLVAEDIASEALIILWEQMKEVGIECPEAFLITTIKNKALDYLKHEAIKEETLMKLESIYREEFNLRISMLESCDPEEVFAAEIQTIMQQTLSRFPKQTSLIFEMRQVENLSNKEIADALGLSVKSIEYHISKVLKALRVSLKDYLSFFFFFFCN
ncbi:hypothetical protein FACS1894181_09520 [Bacteroidia bacterium]|nr:hypothetical protein FACS1894181_09520 [Bacteroidia bacterium]